MSFWLDRDELLAQFQPGPVIQQTTQSQESQTQSYITKLFNQNQHHAKQLLQLVLQNMNNASLKLLCEYLVLSKYNIINGSCNNDTHIEHLQEIFDEFIEGLQNADQDDNNSSSSDYESDNSIISKEDLDTMDMVTGSNIQLNYDRKLSQDECPYEMFRKKIYPDNAVVSSNDTQKLPHRYNTPRVFSQKAHNGFTYRERMNLGPVKAPCFDNGIGWYDSKNQSILIHNHVQNQKYAGRRLTIAKLSINEFWFLAMQVLSGRGSFFPNSTLHQSDNNLVELDPGFQNILNILKGTETVKYLYGPSHMQDKQQKELLFSFVRLYILNENVEDHLEIQRFWFFAGSYVSVTKHTGWNQHPDEPIYGLSTKL